MNSDSVLNDDFLGASPHAHAFLAHEVRNLVNVAILSFEVLKTTGAGVAGDKGQVLRRSLNDLRTLINRSLSDMRTGHGRDVITIGDFVDEIEAAATLEAQAKGILLVVPPVMDGVVVEADRHELAAAVRNVVQNAVKFTKPGTTVGLRVRPSADRVRIDVQDECGGLPDETVNERFRRFEELPAVGTSGLGLAFSRWAVEANDGKIYARNLPDKGCVFTVDLPRFSVPAVMLSAS